MRYLYRGRHRRGANGQPVWKLIKECRNRYSIHEVFELQKLLWESR